MGKYAPSLSLSNTLHPRDPDDCGQSPGSGRRGKDDQGGGNSGGGGKNTMWWDGERSVRANQDNQRELECSAFRTMVKLSKLRPRVTLNKQAGQSTATTPLRSSYVNETCPRPTFLGPGFSVASPSPSTLGVANTGLLSASSSSHNLLLSASRAGGWQGSGASTMQAGLTSSASVPSLTSLAASERPSGMAAGVGGAASSGGAFLRLEQDWRETHVAYLQHRSAVSSCSSVGGAHAHHHGLARASTPSSLGIPGRSPTSHHHRPGSAASTKSNRTNRTHR